MKGRETSWLRDHMYNYACEVKYGSMYDITSGCLRDISVVLNPICAL